MARECVYIYIYIYIYKMIKFYLCTFFFIILPEILYKIPSTKEKLLPLKVTSFCFKCISRVFLGGVSLFFIVYQT